MSGHILNFSSEFPFFYENFFIGNDHLSFINVNSLFFVENFLNPTFLLIFNDNNIHTKSLITFIHQIENMEIFNNLENVTSIYHYSIPNVKLSYPEPFIASPSFMHTDL